MQFPIILKGYAIFNPTTGLWSKGGYKGWSKNPKIWSNIGHLKNHLLLFIHVQYTHDRNLKLERNRFFISNHYRGCQVIDVTTGKPADFDIYTYYHDYIAREKSEHKYYADYDVYEEP